MIIIERIVVPIGKNQTSPGDRVATDKAAILHRLPPDLPSRPPAGGGTWRRNEPPARITPQTTDDEHLSYPNLSPSTPPTFTRLNLKARWPCWATRPYLDAVEWEEGDKLLEAARAHYADLYPLLLMALRTGMRKGELRALQWGDIDFTGRFIEVRRDFSKKNLSTPKSGKSRRVDMSDQLAATLTDNRRHLTEKALRSGVPLPEWVFPPGLGDQGTNRTWTAPSSDV